MSRTVSMPSQVPQQLSFPLERIDKEARQTRNRHFSALCVFRPKLDTDSGPKWTVIPEETGQ
jgi:hypothetical protein